MQVSWSGVAFQWSRQWEVNQQKMHSGQTALGLYIQCGHCARFRSWQLTSTPRRACQSFSSSSHAQSPRDRRLSLRSGSARLILVRGRLLLSRLPGPGHAIWANGRCAAQAFRPLPQQKRLARAEAVQTPIFVRKARPEQPLHCTCPLLAHQRAPRGVGLLPGFFHRWQWQDNTSALQWCHFGAVSPGALFGEHAPILGGSGPLALQLTQVPERLFFVAV